MHLLLELHHLELDGLTEPASGADYRWEREWIDVTGEFDPAAYRRG